MLIHSWLNANGFVSLYYIKKYIIYIFLSGSNYWVFKDTVALPGYPRRLDEWGMKTREGRRVERVEAAFVWAHNGHTYLFSGEEFWRFTEKRGQIIPIPDADYPKKTSLWKGVPTNPDDIISWGNGN